MESAWIDTISDESASPELAQLYDRALDPVTGSLDNVLRVHSLHPAGLSAHLGLYTAAMRGTTGLRTVEREMIALVVSQLNGCGY